MCGKTNHLKENFEKGTIYIRTGKIKESGSGPTCVNDKNFSQNKNRKSLQA
jgi:hypothetical protein